MARPKHSTTELRRMAQFALSTSAAAAARHFGVSRDTIAKALALDGKQPKRRGAPARHPSEKVDAAISMMLAGNSSAEIAAATGLTRAYARQLWRERG
jgi:prolyl-tRNA editing enzyme YbaK/EbsC (Cys-tRNA(Pro) deacylase)